MTQQVRCAFQHRTKASLASGQHMGAYQWHSRCPWLAASTPVAGVISQPTGVITVGSPTPLPKGIWLLESLRNPESKFWHLFHYYIHMQVHSYIMWECSQSIAPLCCTEHILTVPTLITDSCSNIYRQIVHTQVCSSSCKLSLFVFPYPAVST